MAVSILFMCPNLETIVTTELQTPDSRSMSMSMVQVQTQVQGKGERAGSGTPTHPKRDKILTKWV